MYTVGLSGWEEMPNLNVRRLSYSQLSDAKQAKSIDENVPKIKKTVRVVQSQAKNGVSFVDSWSRLTLDSPSHTGSIGLNTGVNV